jgi:hypothetical protein
MDTDQAKTKTLRFLLDVAILQRFVFLWQKVP